PIAVVEPLICLELVMALPLAAHLSHRHLGPREWVGAGCVVAGIGGFLAMAAATGGNASPALSNWGFVAGPTLLAVGLAVVVARGPESPRRASALAVAAGLSFGLTALLTQSFVQEFSNHGFAVLAMWQPYALAVIGPCGFMIGQSAYQSGPLASSLPIIDSLEPTVSVLLAVIAFHQQISLLPAHLAVETGGAAVAVLGIFLLGHSPLVLSLYEQQQERKEEKEVERDRDDHGAGSTGRLSDDAPLSPTSPPSRTAVRPAVARPGA
ncbi:MAG: DMT family transporter, partial [Acidimicrobiales bacterium]